MIDPQVAYDKLAQFQTSDELQNFFATEGIKGCRFRSAGCPISNWLKEHTQSQVLVSRKIHFPGSSMFDHTPATFSFMKRFDLGLYPELIEEKGND